MAYRLTNDEARRLRQAGWEPFHHAGFEKPLMLGRLVGWVCPDDDVIYAPQEAVDMVSKRREEAGEQESLVD